MKKLFVLLAMALATCNLLAKSDFVQVKDGHFVRDGKPYYYVGTNFWSLRYPWLRLRPWCFGHFYCIRCQASLRRDWVID